MFKKNQKGFTLIELLIVVAIIAILAAIAIPQFSAYRKRGYVATVNADAKNAYTASQAYFTDNPSAGAISCADLTAGGFRQSAGVTCASTISPSAGAITMTASPGWGLGTPNAIITFDGAFTPAAQ